MSFLVSIEQLQTKKWINRLLAEGSKEPRQLFDEHAKELRRLMDAYSKEFYAQSDASDECFYQLSNIFSKDVLQLPKKSKEAKLLWARYTKKMNRLALGLLEESDQLSEKYSKLFYQLDKKFAEQLMSEDPRWREYAEYLLRIATERRKCMLLPELRADVRLVSRRRKAMYVYVMYLAYLRGLLE